jgi:hypothetical protein
MHCEREAAAQAVVFDVRSDVMIDMRRAASVDLSVRHHYNIKVFPVVFKNCCQT